MSARQLYKSLIELHQDVTPKHPRFEDAIQLAISAEDVSFFLYLMRSAISEMICRDYLSLLSRMFEITSQRKRYKLVDVLLRKMNFNDDSLWERLLTKGDFEVMGFVLPHLSSSQLEQIRDSLKSKRAPKASLEFVNKYLLMNSRF